MKICENGHLWDVESVAPETWKLEGEEGVYTVSCTKEMLDFCPTCGSKMRDTGGFYATPYSMPPVPFPGPRSPAFGGYRKLGYEWNPFSPNPKSQDKAVSTPKVIA